MTRKVTVTFEDKDSLTVDEIKTNLEAAYGSNAIVSVFPNNNLPLSHIDFGISELITEDQAHIFFDQPELYCDKLKSLRYSIIKKLLYVLNDVIMENEEKFSN